MDILKPDTIDPLFEMDPVVVMHPFCKDRQQVIGDPFGDQIGDKVTGYSSRYPRALADLGSGHCLRHGPCQ